MRRYDLFAIDLDGTLLDRAGRVSDRNLHALRRARDEGVRVVVCTGRGLAECRHVLERIDQQEPVVVAGGSIIACPSTSRTLHRFAVEQRLVELAVERVLALDHPALVLKDPIEAGYDYLVVRGPRRLPLDPVTEWWFASMNVRVRYLDRLSDDEHPEHTVRVGACGLSGVMAEMKESLLRTIEDGVHIHHFPAVVAPEHASRASDGQTLHVLELFSDRANKWSAVSHLAKEFKIGRERIAAIGDEINDVAMLKEAGLGIAMGNAVPAARAVAGRVTTTNNEDGVAAAVEQILSGAW